MVWAGTKQNGKSMSYQMPGSEETAKREKVEYLGKKWSCPFQSNIKKKTITTSWTDLQYAIFWRFLHYIPYYLRSFLSMDLKTTL